MALSPTILGAKMSIKDEKDMISDVLQSFNEEFADKMTSWSDLYDRLKNAALAYTSDPGPGTASVAVATLLSFVLALEELPEEGDVVVIARRLNEIMLTKPEVTGVKFMVLSAYEDRTKKAVEALAAAIREGRLAEDLKAEEVQEAMLETPVNKYLH